MHRLFISLGLMLALGSGCAREDGGRPSKATPPPTETTLTLSCPSLERLTPEGRATLERHLRSSAGWSVVETHKGRYAARATAPAPGYRGGLHGYHSNFQAPELMQTRVLVGLGHPLGLASERRVTRGKLGAPITIRAATHLNQPGRNSYTVLAGGAGVSLEIYEQSKAEGRPFTERAVAEVCAEMTEALKHASAFKELGYAPGFTPEGSIRTHETSVEVSDGMQPGIYNVQAWLPLSAPGPVWMKVIYEGPGPDASKNPPELTDEDVGQPLSSERITPRTTRYLSHGPDPALRFKYTTELTVYEGDWEHEYKARFEVWHHPKGGAPQKLTAVSRLISGWMR